MPDIFLYAGEPNPPDIRLSDPTVLRGGVTITGIVTETQVKQTEAITAAEIYSGAIVESQAKQSEAIAGAEIYSGSVVEIQAKQSEAIAGQEVYSGVVSESQAIQQEAISGTISTGAITGIVTEMALKDTCAAFGTIGPAITSVTPEGHAGYTPGTERWERPKRRKKVPVARKVVPRPIPPPYEPSREQVLQVLKGMSEAGKRLKGQRILPLDRKVLLEAVRAAYAVEGTISSQQTRAVESIRGTVTDTETETLILSLIA